jgi:hypothetical protein
MSKSSFAIGRKVLSLALIFNSVVSLLSATNMLTSFYVNRYAWRPYSPYLIDGSLLWFIILTAVLNIFPAKLIGRVNIRRIIFHHYVYGFLVSSISVLLIALFAPACILLLLTPSLGFQTSGFQTIPVYAGLFFVYGGLTLIIDDICDISLRMGRHMDKLKMRIQKSGKTLQTIHLCSSLTSIYITICTVLWYFENSFWMKSWPLWDASHVVFISNLFVTSIWGLKAAKEKSWPMRFFIVRPKTEPSVHEK